MISSEARINESQDLKHIVQKSLEETTLKKNRNLSNQETSFADEPMHLISPQSASGSYRNVNEVFVRQSDENLNQDIRVTEDDSITNE